MSFTRFGRYVYAVGGNREAARAAGINVRLITFFVYMISGLCVGIAALILTSRLMAAQAISGQGFELQAIAAAVIGGASLFGGRGKISNTIVGAIIMGVLFNGFVMLDVPQPIQQMFVGFIIIIARLARRPAAQAATLSRKDAGDDVIDAEVRWRASGSVYDEESDANKL